MLKSPPALFPHRTPRKVGDADSEAQRTDRERAARAARGGRVKRFTPRPKHWALTELRPCWTAFLTILRSGRNDFKKSHSGVWLRRGDICIGCSREV